MKIINVDTVNLREFKCIFYDFDGVMTDNRVLVDEEGKESVFVNRGDGYAVAQIKKLGIRQVIVSTEQNPVVERRAEKLGIEVIHGVEDKAETIKDWCCMNNVNVSKTIFIGNDLNDLSAMNIVGFKCAPADAEGEILEIADWISAKKGGEGVIRDFLSLLEKL